LNSLAKQHSARNADGVIASSLRHAKDTASDFEIMLNALGRLWLSGVEIDWADFTVMNSGAGSNAPHIRSNGSVTSSSRRNLLHG